MHHTIEWLPAQGAAQQLILLLHGSGGSGADLAPLAQALRASFPQAAVIAPDLPAALPPLQAWVQAQQQRLCVGTAATALGGFGQGAALALALALQHDGLAGRVMAFASSFTLPFPHAPQQTTLHLFHGGADAVHPAEDARRALQALAELHGDATLDIAEGVGHELHPALVRCALQRLQTHIPLRTWQAALGAAPASA